MKQKLFLFFVLFIIGGSIGISREVVHHITAATPAIEKINSDPNKRIYAILVRDSWNNKLLIYEEEVCGMNNAFDRAEVLLEQFNVIYQPGRIDIVLAPRDQDCEP
ncbi:hypothetical protein [Myroides sp. TSA_177.3]|uniref:hypothetical protein n=1 Tax=Myroides sp. TSA_177.3 TaxID=3415650 RepID=UPI0040457037